ncbi:GH116 family glycosyl hydrolase [Thermogemmatispora sp.]|uniref:GH116 family glycosyl hydrolase n=1 Tax=Thermogemmatispora sp. TaxID=1968838 RepID=UPI001E0CE7F2|nr:GH116 family glycosyl hydrolase [Thermogemmatispora sp.]MBX5450894.1 hypothetical protein [Thermogemmatispora sp.]
MKAAARTRSRRGVAPLSGIPLGGLGTGSIEIRADGALHEWQIFNNPPWSGRGAPWSPPISSPVRPGDTLFAIRARPSRAAGQDQAAPAVVRILRERSESEARFTYILSYVESVQEIDFRGEFPFAWLDYRDPALPIAVSLEAWSSFIPGDIKHSALPAAFFTFHLSNPGPEAIEIALLGIIPQIFALEALSQGEGQPQTRSERAPGLSALVFSAADLPVDHPLARGTLVFALLEDGAELVTELREVGDLNAWQSWARSGHFLPDPVGGDPLRALLERIIREGLDPASAYGQLPSLLRGMVDSALVPDRSELQARIAADPIHYQDPRWRWALLLELNLTPDERAQYERERQQRPELERDPAQAAARLSELGALARLLSERAPTLINTRANRLTRGVISSPTIELAPWSERDLTFLLTWYFPNHRGENVGDDLGHRYETWFSDALDVARYVAAERPALYSRTRAFHDLQYSASVPYWLADAINAQLTTLVKSSWLVRDGRFGIWEGLGCCGLQTLDVSYYGSHAVALLFPELEERQLRMTADFQLTPASPRYDEYFLAFAPNRERVWRRLERQPELARDPQQRQALYRAIAVETGLDASGRIPHLFPGSFAVVDAYHMVDLMPKFALQVWRDYRWTANRAALERLWPAVKAAVEHARRIDELKVGLPYHYDHSPAETAISSQTYDTWDFIGYSAYVSSIWLAALKATAQMAHLLGDEDYARDLERQFQESQASMERLLWNGEYYDLWFDPRSGRRNQSCMADQLSGQLYASLLDLGDILPREHVLSALRAIYRYNFVPGRGLVNGMLPPGKQADQPDHWTLGDPRHQADSVWSGTEYAVAVQMLLEGLVSEGLTIMHEVYARYERAGQTWDHQECGGHYYRALSIWLAWPALGGLSYDAPRQALRLQPRLQPADGHWRQPLTLPGCWGQIEHHAGQGRTLLHLYEGQLSLRELILPGAAPTRRTPPGEQVVWLGSLPIAGRRQGERWLFDPPVLIEAGQTLEVRL